MQAEVPHNLGSSEAGCMRSHGTLQEQQRSWADDAGISVDPGGYVYELERNLFRPLSPAASKAFEQGDGGETRGRGASPPKMRALHSSSALAANVFDYWSNRDRTPLASALQLEESISKLCFEHKCPTGLRGHAPNLDVVLTLPSGRIAGIESKLTEWMTPKATDYVPFRDAYFPEGSGLWRNLNMPGCQKLAEAMYLGRQQFRHLDSALLLKHALGLARRIGGRFSLFYVYFDWPCPARDRHLLELEAFSGLIGPELDFRPLSYQSLVERRQCELQPEDSCYRDYLRSRYFPPPSS